MLLVSNTASCPSRWRCPFSPVSPTQTGALSWSRLFEESVDAVELVGPVPAVEMELVEQVVVELLGEDRPVVGPVGPFQRDHVPLIDGADGRSEAAVEWLEPVFVFSSAPVRLRQRLIEQIVSGDGRFVFVAVGDLDPQAFEPVLKLRVGKQLGLVARAVVDVGSRLAAGSAVHVDDDIDIVLLAPTDEIVQQLIPFGYINGIVALGQKQPGIEGRTDGVVSQFGDPPDVGLGDVVAAEGEPELLGRLRADHLGDEGLDLAGPVPLIAELPHVAFRQVPVAQARRPAAGPSCRFRRPCSGPGSSGIRPLGYLRNNQGDQENK